MSERLKVNPTNASICYEFEYLFVFRISYWNILSHYYLYWIEHAIESLSN